MTLEELEKNNSLFNEISNGKKFYIHGIMCRVHNGKVYFGQRVVNENSNEAPLFYTEIIANIKSLEEIK